MDAHVACLIHHGAGGAEIDSSPIMEKRNGLLRNRTQPTNAKGLGIFRHISVEASNQRYGIALGGKDSECRGPNGIDGMNDIRIKVADGAEEPEAW